MSTRRPLTTRDTQWAKKFARTLALSGVRPNTVSLLSIVFAGLSGWAFIASAHDLSRAWIWLAVGALMIQLRLLCNLFDGMIAIEHDQKSKSGDIYNDAPDRVADMLIIAGAGYSLTSISWGAELGWIGACLAVFTAYVRVLGVAVGLPASFIGPMAKQHRMAAMTLTALLTAWERFAWGTDRVMLAGLLAVTIGSGITVLRRTTHIVRALEQR